MIECQICKRMLGTLVGKHLKSHGLSSQEYQEKYPGHPVSAMKPWTDELRARQKQIRTGRRHSEATRAKIGAGNKGKKMPADAVARQKASYQKFLENNGGSPQKGSKRSQEFKARMSEIARNRDPALVQSKVDQMLAARRGSKATPEQKDRYSVARLKYMAENPDKLPSKLFDTTPEREFKAHLDTRGISYSRNKQIQGRLFDFCINDKILVEIDGPYHWNFKMYGNQSMPDEERMALFEQAKKNDFLKNDIAVKNGYQIYRIKVGGNLPEDWHSQLLAQGFDLF